MTRPAGARTQRGFTLTELMVVVAIIGILASLAGAFMRPKVTPYDVANRVSGLVQEGVRRAVMGGAVRSDVAVALTLKARSRIMSSGGAQPTLTLQVLKEDALPAHSAQWITVSTYTVHKDVTADSWSTAVGAYTAVTKSTDFSGFTLYCLPSGTCDMRSIFLSSTLGPSRERKVRVSVMPLGGSVYTRSDWN